MGRIGGVVIYISRYVPFIYKEEEGCALIAYNTDTEHYTVAVNAESREIDITKSGFTDLLSAELWLNKYLKEHKVEVTE